MQTKRIVYIDMIKVFLTCLVVAHHAAQAYGPTGGVWVVDDPLKANWLGKFFFINASYMMGLYFFISGYFMLFSLNRKLKKEFIKDRLVRLGIPLIFFTFFIFLPFNYFSSQQNTGVFNFFIDSYFNKPPIATGHLWFVASLLLYSFIYLVLFGRGVKNRSEELTPTLRVSYIFIYILILSVVSAFVRLKYPIDIWRTWIIPVEIAHIPQYLSLFLIGALFNKYRWLDSFKLSVGLYFLGIAVAVFILSNYLPQNVQSFWLTNSFVESLLCVGISIGMLTIFRYYVNRSNNFFNALSANAYGIYLFHLFVVIGLQHVLLDWNIGANTKFIIVTVFGILISYLISAGFRRVGVIRKII